MSSKPLLAVTAFLALAVHVAADLSHRKAALTVQVQTASETPLPGATVEVEMLNHDFRFGTAVKAGHLDPENGNFDQWTATEVEKYFNSVTFGNVMKWSFYEARTPERMLQVLGHAQSYKAFGGSDQMRVRGHATIWGAEYQVPADVRSSEDAVFIHGRIIEHIGDYHTTFKDQGIDNFDLYNEHFHERAFLIEKLVDASDLAAQAAEVATWFNEAKKVDPNAILFINDYNILNFWQENDSDVIAYKEFVDAIRDVGGQVDGIGLQAHMDRFITKEQLLRRYDILSAPMPPTENYPSGLPGLRLEVTELDINAQGWTTATDQQQADVVANVLEASFEHPSVDGVTMWGMNDFFHWRDNAILIDDLNESNNTRIDPVIKQSGQVWIDRVTMDWWTDESGTSDSSGDYSTSVFKGKHKITVTFNGETQEIIETITEDKNVIVEFAFSAVDSSSYVPPTQVFRRASESRLTGSIGQMSSKP